jgi:hypothetical protein
MTKTKKQKSRAQQRKRTVNYVSPVPKPIIIRESAQKAKSPRNEDSFGAKLGALIGNGAQSLFKMITGFGDYKIESNTLMDGGMSPPQMVNATRNNGVILRHREYIGDVLASTTFQNTTFNINPGLQGSFPYLSQVAAAFEMYKMRGLVYEFKSTSSDSVLSSNTSSALGVVAMATQYNSVANSFTSLLQLENHEFANASKPSCDFVHPVECKRSELALSEMYVRTGNPPSNADLRLYDLGVLNVAVSGSQASGGVLGQLWASYEVEFYQPLYATPFSVLSDHSVGSSITNVAWFGTTHAFPPGNTLNAGIGPNQLVFPNGVRDGTYMILVRYDQGSAIAATAPTVGTLTNCSLIQSWINGTSTNGNSSTVLATQSFHLCYLISISGPAATFNLTSGTGVISSSSINDLYVMQVALNLH